MCIIARPAFTAPAVDSSDYKLAPGDRIGVTVFGNTDLSGEFVIDGLGKILFPVVGPIEVGSLSVKDAEQRLTAALGDGILVNPSLFVRILELRPIQVIGDVRNAGSFAFRPGTIVKSAIGLAGGYGMSLLSPGAAAAEFLIAEERLKILEASAWRLRVRQARLTAQLKGLSAFDPPPKESGVLESEFTRLVAEETEQLTQQLEARNRKQELLRSQRAPMAAENEAINAQISNERKQADIIGKQIQSYEKLQQSGLARFDTMIQMQLNAATKESMIGRLEGEKSRLRSSIGELEIRLQDATDDYTKQTSVQILEVSQKLSEIDVAIPQARQVRLARLREASGGNTIAMRHQYFISRLVNGAPATFETNENALVEPGDVIEVRTETTDISTSTDAATSAHSEGDGQASALSTQ